MKRLHVHVSVENLEDSTLDTIPTYGEHGRAATEATATSCCSPVQQLTSTVAPKTSTCC